MANAITLVEKYLPVLDEQYKYESKSAILDTPPEFIQSTREANKFKIAKITVQGLANYSRSTGFVDGDETLEWEEYTYPWDRGRSFQIDDMDNLESMGLAFGRLSGTFNRMQVIPEIDAVRFATYAAKAGNKVDTVPTKETILGMLDTAQTQMDDDEIPEMGRICFLTPEVMNMIQQSDALQKMIDVVETTTTGSDGRSITTKVMYYNGMRLVKVPQSRFYDKVKLNVDGEGGYAADTGAKKIAFMIIHPSAVFQDRKHEISRIWAPTRSKAAGTDGVNPKADAWKFDYRLYHGAFTYEQKSKGIYLCTGAAVGG